MNRNLYTTENRWCDFSKTLFWNEDANFNHFPDIDFTRIKLFKENVQYEELQSFIDQDMK